MPPLHSTSDVKVRRLRGLVLTPIGLKRLQEAIQRAEIQEHQGNRFTLEELSDRINISTKTLSRLWSLRSGVDQKTLRLCFSAFGLNLSPEDYTTINSLETFAKDSQSVLTYLRSQRVAAMADPISPPGSFIGQMDQGEWLNLTYPGGPVAVDSPYYIDRPPIEELALREVTQPGCVIRIRAPRGMGKSSLTMRLLHQAERLGYRTVLLDCNQIDSQYLHDLNKLLRCFCQQLSIELGIPPRLNEYWNEDIGSKLSCTFYVRRYLLQQVEAPFVLALNEVDWLFEYPYIAHEFFPMLRSWYEAARRDAYWQKLRQIVVYSTEDYPELDINYSPFNVGLSLTLPEFTPEQVQELANRYGLNWTLEQVKPLIALVSGHPTMLQIVFYHLCTEGADLNTLLQQAAVDGGVFRYYLHQRWTALQKQPRLLEAMAAMMQSDRSIQLDSVLIGQLESLGLIRREAGDRVQPRCHLYRLYFKQQLALL